MTPVQKLEQTIDDLSWAQIEELYLWLDEKYHRLVDAGLEAAVAVGRFDQRIDQALEDEAAG